MNPNNQLSCNIAQIMDSFLAHSHQQRSVTEIAERKKKGANPCSYADHRSLKEYERINDGSVTEIRYGPKEV